MLAVTMDAIGETAKNVAAIAGCIVAVVAVYRVPAVSGTIRWVFRRLLSEPLSSWAQTQVSEVVDHRLQAATAWLAEGQERMGQQVTALREEWTEGQAAHGERLDAIDLRTKQLQPNGGKSIYDRLARIELSQIASTGRDERHQRGLPPASPGEPDDEVPPTPRP